MARIVALSSQVARGHVGLSAIVPTLQRLGHEVVALPTILLSNHPGHARFAGERVSPELLARMLDALDANGWLGDIDGILTGYLPSAAHVAVAAEVVRRIRARSPLALHLCDPVLGDDPKGLYVAFEAAEAVRDTLLPLADIATPNRFELAWLSGADVTDVASAIDAARRLGRPDVLATSIPEGANTLHTLAVSATTALSVRVARRDGVPNGTGDMLAALHLGWTLSAPAKPDNQRSDPLAIVTGAIHTIIEASKGADELRLVASADDWARPTPLTVIVHEG